MSRRDNKGLGDMAGTGLCWNQSKQSQMDISRSPARTDSPTWPERKHKLSLDLIFLDCWTYWKEEVLQKMLIYIFFFPKAGETVIATFLEEVFNNMIKSRACKAMVGRCSGNTAGLPGQKRKFLIQDLCRAVPLLSNVVQTDLPLHVFKIKHATNSYYTEVF